MSQSLNEKLHNNWPMFIGNSNKLRQELLSAYESEQAQQQADVQEQLDAALLKQTNDFEEIANLRAEIELLKATLEAQKLAHDQEFARLHEQVIQKIALMQEQAELYFVKNGENEAK